MWDVGQSAFGAALYHLLTNQSPAEAKERFLDPNRLTAPRAINPEISIRTEKAISDKMMPKLKAAVDTYAKSFA